MAGEQCPQGTAGFPESNVKAASREGAGRVGDLSSGSEFPKDPGEGFKSLGILGQGRKGRRPGVLGSCEAT